VVAGKGLVWTGFVSWFGELTSVICACAAPPPTAPTGDPSVSQPPAPAPSGPIPTGPGVPAAGSPQVGGPSGRLLFPGDLLDLGNWSLTLPTGEPGNPDDVAQPALRTYRSAWFRLDDAADGVAFTANAGGVTTENSRYPRSELREMDGPAKASWSNESGTHILDVREAVTVTPSVKPEVVTAQIHDAKDDVIEIRLEGTRLLAEYDDGDSSVVLDPAYVLGTPYDLRIVATGGRVVVSYNGTETLDAPLRGSGWYFKAGSYVQSNEERGESPDAVGTVVVQALKATHRG